MESAVRQIVQEHGGSITTSDLGTALYKRFPQFKEPMKAWGITNWVRNHDHNGLVEVNGQVRLQSAQPIRSTLAARLGHHPETASNGVRPNARHVPPQPAARSFVQAAPGFSGHPPPNHNSTRRAALSDLRDINLKPRNDCQATYQATLQNNVKTVVICFGTSGAGKVRLRHPSGRILYARSDPLCMPLTCFSTPGGTPFRPACPCAWHSLAPCRGPSPVHAVGRRSSPSRAASNGSGATTGASYCWPTRRSATVEEACTQSRSRSCAGQHWTRWIRRSARAHGRCCDAPTVSSCFERTICVAARWMMRSSSSMRRETLIELKSLNEP